jgi:hypothetical protein
MGTWSNEVLSMPENRHASGGIISALPESTQIAFARFASSHFLFFMKALFALCLLFISLFSLAQPYPAPDFVEKPMYYDTNTKEIHAIERQIKPYMQATAGFNETFRFRDPRSFFRIKKSDGVQFLIKLVNSVEPDLILFLYPLSATDKDRFIKIHVSLTPANQNQGFIPFHYHRVAENIYLLTFDNVEPGEYVWYLKNASYLFGVD